MKRDYTHNQLEMATSNVTDGGLGICKATDKFKIPFTTLHKAGSETYSLLGGRTSSE